VGEVSPASVVKLRRAWFIACAAPELKDKPRPFKLQGTPLVLFRQGDGKPAALLDRCPHRNVPLSLGRVCEGQLECAYHGWRFDGAGACKRVPGLVDGSETELRSRAAEAYPCREQDGFIWVWADATSQPDAEPFKFPHFGEAGFTSVTRSFTVNATLHAVAENALDVPHTAFLHGGLFRTAEKKNEIEVVVRRHDTFAEAEYLGEPAPKGMVGRLLAPGGGVVRHFDRFLLPSVTMVEYHLGESSHLFSTAALTPVNDFETAVHAVVTYKLPVPGWLVRPFVEPVALRIFRQDERILRRQTEVIRNFGGERYTSTELDVLGHEIWRLLKQAAGLEKPTGSVQEHRVKMRT
jgi:phenylpropionate dioxygenase-like ring-hydroxylating dioxygenase large terminal subunit